MKKMRIVLTAVMAVAMTNVQGQNDVQLNDSISNDSTMWYNQAHQLGEVTVKSRLPKTRVKGDAMRTTVAGTILENAGNMSDLLNKIPTLEAERDGAVKVLGRGEAEIYINGRKVLDMQELSRLRAEQIQHIDVVQNPGARYAASTKAVVRITLKKAQGEGISFQDYASYMYQYGHTETNNLDVNYRTGGLDVTASFWAGRYGHSKSLQTDKMFYYVGQQQNEGITKQNSKNIWRGWSPQLQVNYMVDENHSFGAYYKYDRHPSGEFFSLFNTDCYEDGVYTERSESRISQKDRFSKHIFNTYYNGKIGKLGIDWNLDGLFDDTKTPGYTTETMTPVVAVPGISTAGVTRSIDSNTKSGNNFWATKLIFSYPIWKGNFSLGGEYSYNHRTDAYSFTATDEVPVKATDSEINEKSAAGFIEYGRQFDISGLNSHLSTLYVQAGLRYEHLKNDYFNFGQREDEVCRNYGDWFPSLSVSMPIGLVQLSLSYRQDIDRPHYSDLTSSTIYLNRYAYQSGNPYLRPTYTHSVVMNAAYKWLGIAVNYGRIKDAETMSTEPFPGSNDPLVSLVHPINTKEDYNQLSINPYARPTINLKSLNCTWHPTWSVYAVFQDYKTPTADGTIKTLSRPYVMCAWDNTLELPKNWRFTTYLRWNPKGDYNNFRINRHQFNTSLVLQHDFSLRRMGEFTLDLRCRDVFNTDKSDAIVYGVRELTAINPARRTFSVELTWKFNEARSKYRGSGAGDKQKARM